MIFSSYFHKKNKKKCLMFKINNIRTKFHVFLYKYLDYIFKLIISPINPFSAQPEVSYMRPPDIFYGRPESYIKYCFILLYIYLLCFSLYSPYMYLSSDSKFLFSLHIRTHITIYYFVFP